MVYHQYGYRVQLQIMGNKLDSVLPKYAEYKA